MRAGCDSMPSLNPKCSVWSEGTLEKMNRSNQFGSNLSWTCEHRWSRVQMVTWSESIGLGKKTLRASGRKLKNQLESQRSGNSNGLPLPKGYPLIGMPFWYAIRHASLQVGSFTTNGVLVRLNYGKSLIRAPRPSSLKFERTYADWVVCYISLHLKSRKSFFQNEMRFQLRPFALRRGVAKTQERHVARCPITCLFKAKKSMLFYIDCLTHPRISSTVSIVLVRSL